MADRWMDSHRRDAWRRKSKDSGYRARSAFKLLQIQERFNIMRQGDVILDVGAHPGGWSQVAVESVGDAGFVVGVDLEPCEPIDGCTFIVGDVTEDEVQRKLVGCLDGRDVNTVVSDISPQLTGNWVRDQIISLQLVAMVFDFSLPLLTAGGNFVTKVFQGEGIENLIELVRPRFTNVRRHSPEASRKSSAEVFLVCRNHTPWSGTGYSIRKQLELSFDAGDESEPEPAATGFRLHRAR